MSLPGSTRRAMPLPRQVQLAPWLELAWVTVRRCHPAPRPTYDVLITVEAPGIAMRAIGEHCRAQARWGAYHSDTPCRSRRQPCLHAQIAALAGELAELRHQAALYQTIRRGGTGEALSPAPTHIVRARFLARELASLGFELREVS